MGWDTTTRPPCGLCDAPSGVPEINLPREHAPGCQAGLPVADRLERERRLAEEKLAIKRDLKATLASMRDVEAPSITRRRLDMQRGARAAARLVRQHASRIGGVEGALSEGLAQMIEDHWSDAEIERRLLASLEEVP